MLNKKPILLPRSGNRLPKMTQHRISRRLLVGTIPHSAVAAVSVPVQLLERCHLLGARGIQMNVAHLLQQVGLFLPENICTGFETNARSDDASD